MAAQGEVDTAIAELESLRKAVEADEAAIVKARRNATNLQSRLRQMR
jgi:hypothetical protein